MTLYEFGFEPSKLRHNFRRQMILWMDKFENHTKRWYLENDMDLIFKVMLENPMPVHKLLFSEIVSKS